MEEQDAMTVYKSSGRMDKPYAQEVRFHLAITSVLLPREQEWISLWADKVLRWQLEKIPKIAIRCHP